MKQEYINLVKELEDNNIPAEEVKKFLELKGKLTKNKIIIKKICNLHYQEIFTLNEFLKDIKYVIIASECIEFRKNPSRLGLILLHELFAIELYKGFELEHCNKTEQKEKIKNI